jgi:HemY protein
LKPEEAPSARAKRLAALAGMNPEHPESQILSAAVSISAGRLEEARETLRPIADRFPVARVCLLMADIERGFGGDSLIAREWSMRAMRAPRDAQWHCSACARTHNEWQATCNACSGFDTLSWQSGARGTVETMSPLDAAKAYAEATESGTALYRDAVKQDDIRPPVNAPSTDNMRDVSPSTAGQNFYGPPRAPDDPGPDGDDFALSGDDRSRKRSSTW